MSDRIPPHNLDAERAVLGAVLIEGREALPRVIEVLRASDFYTEVHRVVFETMLRLGDRGEPVDLITLSEELRRTDHLEFVGGAAALALLVEQASIAAHLMAYVRIVHDLSTLRQTIQRATTIIDQGFRGEAMQEVVQELDRLHLDVTQRLTLTAAPLAPTIHDVLVETARDIASPVAAPVLLPWPGLIAATGGGLHAGEYVLLGARPGRGKTAAALLIAVHAARQDIPTLVISREMPLVALGRRIYAQQGHIYATALRRGDLHPDEWSTLERVRTELAEVPLWLDARPATVRQVIACVRRHVERCQIRLAVLDYLQLIRVAGVRDPRERVETVSASLKALAQDLGIVVLAISSLARLQRDHRGRELPPTLGDLRESGQLEHDADWVWLLHQPQRDDMSALDLIIAKGRDGSTGVVPLSFLAVTLQIAEAREPGEEAPF